MTAALLLAAALLAPGPRPGAAGGPAEPVRAAPTATSTDEAIDAALGTIHGRPDSPARWRALGPGALPALERIARDPAAMPSRRARALEGLSFLGGDRARAAALALLGTDDVPFSVRAAALEAAGRILGPGELAGALRPVLEGARRPVDRAVAAEVLSERSPSACGAVRARAAREAERDRPGFDRALARCASTGR